MAGAAYDNGYDYTEYGRGKGCYNAGRFAERQGGSYKITQNKHYKRQNIDGQRTFYNAFCRCFYHYVLAALCANGILHNGLHEMLVFALIAAVAVSAAYAETLNDDLRKSVITNFSYYCFLKHLYITFADYTP